MPGKGLEKLQVPLSLVKHSRGLSQRPRWVGVNMMGEAYGFLSRLALKVPESPLSRVGLTVT